MGPYGFEAMVAGEVAVLVQGGKQVQGPALLCTNSEGAERCRERLVLRKPEPSDGVVVCKPLIGFMVGDECRKVGSGLGLQLTEDATECLKVLIAGQQGQELRTWPLLSRGRASTAAGPSVPSTMSASSM
ncbi:hypothetical protein ACFQ8S_26780 [Streptomyces virginiae]|uniref:hypothetical protein n=1 Tax=Streptomyces virginiae TaxID=1961 RepID=UPI00369BE041